MCFRMYFGVLGAFRIINCYFEYRIRILCIFFVYGNMFKRYFRHFLNKIENVTRSVNNVRTNYLGEFGVLNGPTSCSISPVGRR